MRRRVAPERVGDQRAGLTAWPLHQRTDEARGCVPVTLGVHENVDHVAVLVDRPPQLVRPPLHGDDQFVQVPRVAHPSSVAPKRTGRRRAAGLTPRSNRLLGDGHAPHAPLSQEILGLSNAQTESGVEPDRVPADLGRKSVSRVAGDVAGPQPTLPGAAST